MKKIRLNDKTIGRIFCANKKPARQRRTDQRRVDAISRVRLPASSDCAYIILLKYSVNCGKNVKKL